MLLCTYRGSSGKSQSKTINCLEEPFGSPWTSGAVWSCQGTKPAEVQGDMDGLPELGEEVVAFPMVAPREASQQSDESCNGQVMIEGPSEVAGEVDALNEVSTSCSSNEHGRPAPPMGEPRRRERVDRGGGAARTSGGGPIVPPESPAAAHQPESSSTTLLGSSAENGVQAPVYVLGPGSLTYGGPQWPERLMSALPGDGRELSNAQVQGKLPRCTGRDPFWVYAKASPLERPRHVKGQERKLLPMHCLHDAVASIDLDSEMVEVPESELMTVQLRTREQRLDWRDFLCEAVAGCKAASLFQLYDTEAEPPRYARPPPSALTPESVERWYQHSSGRPPLPCVAPEGAGLCEVGGETPRGRISPLSAEAAAAATLCSIDTTAPRVADGESWTARSTASTFWSEHGPLTARSNRPVSPRSFSDEPNVFGDGPPEPKMATLPPTSPASSSSTTRAPPVRQEAARQEAARLEARQEARLEVARALAKKLNVAEEPAGAKAADPVSPTTPTSSRVEDASTFRRRKRSLSLPPSITSE